MNRLSDTSGGKEGAKQVGSAVAKHTEAKQGAMADLERIATAQVDKLTKNPASQV